MRRDRRNQPDRSPTKRTYLSFSIEPLFVEFVPGETPEMQIERAVYALKDVQFNEIRRRAALLGHVFASANEFQIFYDTQCRIEINGHHHSITGPDRLSITVFYDTINVTKTDKLIRVTLGDSGAINVPHNRLYIPHRKIEFAP